MGSYTGFKKLGDKALDYMMSHRPAVPEDLSEGFHDLDNLFPGIYSGKHRYSTNMPKVDDEAMRAIWKAQGNPEAMIDIYRAVPKGVRDFNTGDWVTTSKAYAKEHGRHSLDDDFEIIKGKARAADISEPGDSIAEQGYWGLPMTGKLSRGILALLASGAGTAALAPGEAEAAPAVLAKDGRRLKEAFEKAARGALTPDEPDFRFDDAFIPSHAFESMRAADPSFTTPELGLSEGDIFHIWNDHGKEISPERLEDGVHAILYGDNRFHTIGNPPHENGLGSIVDGKGYNASLMPESDYTHVYQMNPINAKRLLKKRSLSDPMDGAAGHPISIQPDNSGSISQRAGLSADMGSLDGNLSPSGSGVKGTFPWARVLGGDMGAAASDMPSEPEYTDAGELVAYEATPQEIAEGNRRYERELLQEPGLEAPWLDPIDIMTAPIGVVGKGAKAAAMALDPAISYGMDKLGGMVGRLWGK